MRSFGERMVIEREILTRARTCLVLFHEELTSIVSFGVLPLSLPFPPSAACPLLPSNLRPIPVVHHHYLFVDRLSDSRPAHVIHVTTVGSRMPCPVLPHSTCYVILMTQRGLDRIRQVAHLTLCDHISARENPIQSDELQQRTASLYQRHLAKLHYKPLTRCRTTTDFSKEVPRGLSRDTLHEAGVNARAVLETSMPDDEILRAN